MSWNNNRFGGQNQPFPPHQASNRNDQSNSRNNRFRSQGGPPPPPTRQATLGPPSSQPIDIEQTTADPRDPFWMRRRHTRDDSFPELKDIDFAGFSSFVSSGEPLPLPPTPSGSKGPPVPAKRHKPRRENHQPNLDIPVSPMAMPSQQQQKFTSGRNNAMRSDGSQHRHHPEKSKFDNKIQPPPGGVPMFGMTPNGSMPPARGRSDSRLRQQRQPEMSMQTDLAVLSSRSYAMSKSYGQNTVQTPSNLRQPHGNMVQVPMPGPPPPAKKVKPKTSPHGGQFGQMPPSFVPPKPQNQGRFPPQFQQNHKPNQPPAQSRPPPVKPKQERFDPGRNWRSPSQPGRGNSNVGGVGNNTMPKPVNIPKFSGMNTPKLGQYPGVPQPQPQRRQRNDEGRPPVPHKPHGGGNQDPRFFSL